jgi:hypothetical protein
MSRGAQHSVQLPSEMAAAVYHGIGSGGSLPFNMKLLDGLFILPDVDLSRVPKEYR